MTTTAQDLADRLLDAQVAHLRAELTGPEGVALVQAEVRELLVALDDVPVREVVDVSVVQATVRSLLEAVGDSPAVAAVVTELAPLVRDLDVHRDHTLGDVVDRAAVERVVEVLAGSETLREQVLERLGRSPAVSNLALRFVQALVGDAVQQNRERAEKVPGMKSLLGVGDFAARQARGLTPKGIENLVGGAADKGAQAAMDRVSRALVDTFDEAAVRRAAMEVWDLQAEQPVDAFHDLLTDEEMDALLHAGQDAWTDLHRTPWFRGVVDAAVAGFLDRHADHTVGELLDDLGLDHDVVVDAAGRHAPGVLAALDDSGAMEAWLRRRLAPFYASPAALEILSDASD